MNIEELKAKLRKIEALFAGATTPGERLAAGAAMERIKERLRQAGQVERPIEMKFTLADGWSRRLFIALCRRYGLSPYRYPRQRHTTVMLRVPESFAYKTLWPEYQQLSAALQEYLSAVTDRVIREEVFRDIGEADSVP